jgi:hypothetical protein
MTISSAVGAGVIRFPKALHFGAASWKKQPAPLRELSAGGRKFLGKRFSGFYSADKKC